MNETINLSSEGASVRARLLCREKQLCVLPAVAFKALSLSRDPRCTVEAFAGVVRRDLALAKDILALANNATFAGARPTASIEDAVIRLGFHQCRNLIVSSSVGSLIRRAPIEKQWIREAIWRHSFLTGTIAVRLGRELRLGHQGEEFAAGLMHDLGRLLLAVAVPERFLDADPLDFGDEEGLVEAERRTHGVDHAELGAWYAGMQKLPAELTEPMRLHHRPQDAGDHANLTELVAASDHMANHLQRTAVPNGYLQEDNHWLGVISMRSRSALDDDRLALIMGESLRSMGELPL